MAGWSSLILHWDLAEDPRIAVLSQRLLPASSADRPGMLTPCDFTLRIPVELRTHIQLNLPVICLRSLGHWTWLTLLWHTYNLYGITLLHLFSFSLKNFPWTLTLLSNDSLSSNISFLYILEGGTVAFSPHKALWISLTPPFPAILLDADHVPPL